MIETINKNKIKHSYSGNNTLDGRGYSSDSQQQAIEVCYNMEELAISDQQSEVNLAYSMTFLEFTNSLGISFGGTGDVAGFMIGGEFDYLQYVKDEFLSISLNYYENVFATVYLQPQSYGISLLNGFGGAAYQAYLNGAKNNFNVLCGDNIISQYNIGASLMMSLKLTFASYYAMEKFQESAGGKFGDIFSDSEKIQDVATQQITLGSISIVAYQVGGDPGRLANILSKDSSGSFYILECDLQNMKACTMAAGGMLNYTQNDFQNQFNIVENVNVTDLGIGQYRFFTKRRFWNTC